MSDSGITVHTLYDAAARGKRKLLERALDLFPGHLQSQDVEGKTPFAYAMKFGRIEIVQLLLSRSITISDIVRLDINDQNSITIAAKAGHWSCVEFVCQFLFDRQALGLYDYKGLTLFHYGVRKGLVRLLEILIRFQPELFTKSSRSGTTPVAMAAYFRQVETLKSLVRIGNEIEPGLGNKYLLFPCDNGATPMHNATHSASDVSTFETLYQLIDDNHGAEAAIQSLDVLSNDVSSRQNAAMRKDERVIEAIYRYSGSVDGTSQHRSCSFKTSFHHAINKLNDRKVYSPQMIITLVRLGSQQMEWPDQNGETPLHYAVRYKLYSIVALLKALSTPEIYLTEHKLGLLSPNKRKIYSEPVKEEEIKRIRFQVYFETTLIWRCLATLR